MIWWIENPISFSVATMVAIHLAGILAALDALFNTRTAQGALAWSISLVLFPYLMLPFYLLFGRRWLRGYRKLSRRMVESRRQSARFKQQHIADDAKIASGEFVRGYETLERIAQSRFRPRNTAKLLSDGREFYEALLSDIRSAREQVDLCFYVVRSDNIGRRLKDELIAAVQRGLTVRFLYDDLGSYGLTSAYIAELKAAHITFVTFNRHRGWKRFFHINFRNHRKIALIDHRIAYVGGFNVGDEYLGLSPDLGPWRDTQVRLEGDAVYDIESVFLADLAWATSKPTEAPPDPRPCGSSWALVAATGPADEEERAILFVLELITRAKDRIWISSPYFVPDEAIMTALNLAALRGVDVRIVVPSMSDNRIVQLATLYHAYEAVSLGIQVFQYRKGFLHQKAIVVDSAVAVISTANLDNRSLRLNFEISLAFADDQICEELAARFEQDFRDSVAITRESTAKVALIDRCGGGLARLLGPLL